jgi:mono/diheme cytochrome c family protein
MNAAIRPMAAVVVAGLAAAWLAGAAEAQRPDPIKQGSDLFFAQGCHGCHTVGKVGTSQVAADLSRIGTRYSKAQLTRWLRDPAAQKPTAHMPRIVLTDAEVEALAAYLASLR